MSRENISHWRAAAPEQRDLPMHWFPKPELPRQDEDLLPLIRNEWFYEQVRAEYERGSRMELRGEKAREDFLRRIRTPQHLDAFVREVQMNNHSLVKVFQLSAIGQCVSAYLTAHRPGRSAGRTAFSMLRSAYSGASAGRLSGHVGEAIAGQLIERSGWEARYPSPVLDALLGFDRIAYHKPTNSWRVIQCKTDNQLAVPFAAAGPDHFKHLDRALGPYFEPAASDQDADSPRNRATPEATLKQWGQSLEQLASTCAILEKQYPGNTIMPMLIATAGIGSEAYKASADPATGLLRANFCGSIDFDHNRALLPE